MDAFLSGLDSKAKRSGSSPGVVVVNKHFVFWSILLRLRSNFVVVPSSSLSQVCARHPSQMKLMSDFSRF